MLNANRPKEIAPQYFGKVLLGLGLHTKKITQRESDHRLKKAVIFHRKALVNVFKNFKLPFPADFDVTNVTKTDKPISNNGLTVVTLTETSTEKTNQCHHFKLSNNGIYKNGNIDNIEIGKPTVKIKKQFGGWSEMQIHYTPETLLSELRAQGVLIQPTTDGNLFLDGEMSDLQFSAVKNLKPQIINFLESRNYRFAPNEHFFNDLAGCRKLFDLSNDAARRFIEYLHKKLEPAQTLEINFNQPTTEAYKAELKLIAEIERSDDLDKLKTAADDFIETHKRTRGFSDWLVNETPLFQIKIFDNSKLVESSVGNAVQVSIIALFWSGEFPDIKHEAASGK